MKIVQLLGTNGAGKSSVARAIALSDQRAEVRRYPAAWLTFVPTLSVVLVGDYLKDGVKIGLDTFSGKAAMLAALDCSVEVAKTFGYSRLLWEGIIIMTRQYHGPLLDRGLEPVYVVLDIPLEECYRRLEVRSGKPRSQLFGGGKKVASRAREVVCLTQWFVEQRARVVHLDATVGVSVLAEQVVELI